MATASPPRPAPAAKSEAFVARQLARARQRIRLLDLAAALLGFAALTLLYGVGMILLDGRLELTSHVRQRAFLAYVIVAAVYLAVTLVRPLFRRINPYYAARQVEQTLPEAKNSVVNWLDLHDQPLPSAIRTAVAQRAAKDLAGADLDAAISGRRTAWLGGIVGVLLFLLFVQLVTGGRQFLSLFGRAFAPFVEAAIQTRTQLTLLQPDGDVTVPLGRAVSFRVLATGRVPAPERPDAIRLQYRYHAGDPYEEQRFERGDEPGEWVTTVPAFQVHNGFWFKVAGGDAETPEYRVGVRATPLLTDFEVKYHFRPYLGWADQLTREPNLKALRGTEVTLLARANRNLRSAQLTFDAAKTSVAADLVHGEPQAMRFRFVLDRDDTYRIWFISDEGERNAEPMPYEIKVLRDRPPQVTLTKPGQDTTLPVNGVLRLGGMASDDFGVSALKLRMRLVEKEPLPDKPYRDGKPLRQADGSWPQQLEYADFVELEKVKLADGPPLKPGMVIEYWLEAADNCDYPPPGPNVGRSETFKLTLAEPQTEEQKKEQKKEAEQERQRRQEQQDRDLQQPKPGENQKPESKDKQQPQPESPQDKKLQEQKDRLSKAIEEQEKQQLPKPDKQDQNSDKNGEQKNKDGNQGQGQAPDKQQDKKDQAGKQPQQNPDGGGNGTQGKPDKKEQGGQGANPPQPGGDPQKQPEKKPGDKGPNSQQPQPGGDPQKQPGGKGDGTPNKADQADPKQQGKSEPQPKEGNSGQGPAKANGQSQGSPKPQGPDQPKAGNEQKPQPGANNASGDKNGKTENGSQGNQSGKPQEKSGDPKAGTGGDPKNDAANGQQPGAKQPKPDPAKSVNDADKPPSSPDKTNSTKPQAETKSGQGNDGKSGTEKGGQASAEKNGKPEAQSGAGSDKKNDGTKKDATDKSAEAAGNRNQAKPEKSDGQSGQPADEKVKDLVERLKSGDPQARKEAAERLKKLRDGMQNPRDREALDKAMKEAGDAKSSAGSRKEQRTGDGKPAEAGQAEGRAKGKQPGAKAGENPGKPGEPSATAKSGKPGEGPGQKSEQSQAQNGQKTNGKPDTPPNQRPGTPGSSPGGPTTGDRHGKATPDNRDDAAANAGSAADPRFQKKAGELQLEDFKKKVTKDVLQKANMTEAEYRQFLKAYEEALKRQRAAPPAKPEKLADPKRPGGALRNEQARRVKGVLSKDAAQSADPGTAPPEFRDAYRDFTENLSKLKRDKKNP